VWLSVILIGVIPLIAAIFGIITGSVFLCDCCQSVLLEANVKIVRTSHVYPLLKPNHSCSLHHDKTCHVTCNGAMLRIQMSTYTSTP
jgi:hypothetical protein